MKVLTYPIGPLLTNCYVLTCQSANGKALVVDPAFAEDRILSFLEKHDLTLAGILLTHCHFDHMWALDALVEKTGVPFYCPALDAQALRDPKKNASYYFGKELVVNSTPTILLKKGDQITLGEEKLTVLETPGHTKGSICLYTDGILLSGDTMFCRGYGRTDLPGGNMGELKNSLHKLLSLDDCIVYPGHGETTTIHEEKIFYGM